MPLPNPVTPGSVDWTGENPGILLKDEKGNFSAMALFFRVAWSPVGQGHVLLLYGSPDKAESTQDAPNVLVSDNAELAEFLKHNFMWLRIRFSRKVIRWVRVTANRFMLMGST